MKQKADEWSRFDYQSEEDAERNEKQRKVRAGVIIVLLLAALVYVLARANQPG